MAGTEKPAAKVDKLASVKQYGAYHLVSYGVWEVTVDNAGMIKLPQLCSPDSADDFIACFQAAVPVARQQREDNIAAQRSMNEFFEAQRQQRAELHARAKTVTPRQRDAVKKSTKAAPGQRRASKTGGPRGARQKPGTITKSVPAKAATPAKKAAPAKTPPKRAAQQRGKQ